MPHISVPSSMPCQISNLSPLNPLISKCEIKVCYVGDEPNRNGSIITREVAEKMANSLLGCPIVGYYNEKEEDFEEHSRIIDVSNGKFEIKDKTRPYGFVSMDAKVWFQKFLDDGIEHEYLCTEGYIWTKVYPESQRIIEQGNNQSMELFGETLEGNWSMDDNGMPKFFIINEALISKLCVLGENVEPCFEGAQIASSFSLSLDDDFKQQIYSMKNELKEVLAKGGRVEMEDIENKQVEEEFKKKPDEEEEKKAEEEKKPAEKEEKPAEKKEEKSAEEEEEKPKKQGKDGQDKKDDSEEDMDEEDDKKKKKAGKKYSLEEIPEYIELMNKFSSLQKDYDALLNEVSSLREFKTAADRKAKQEMIDGFYMLSDEDKKDCIENIDTYSLDDIEAKLSIICVRNKVNFNLDSDKKQEENPAPTIYELNKNDDNDTAPAWIKAVRNTAKNM